MRLFTAVWPAEQAVRHLSEKVRAMNPEQLSQATAGLRKFRFTPPEYWHMTLRFHGHDAYPASLIKRLERGMSRFWSENATPPRLRLVSAGAFRGVLWVGVEPAGESDAEALRGLARAAGADPHSFRAHLTVARWSEGRPDRTRLHGLLDAYAGPWWSVDEVALVRSDRVRGVLIYSTVHRVPLLPAAHGDADSAIYP